MAARETSKDATTASISMQLRPISVNIIAAVVLGKILFDYGLHFVRHVNINIPVEVGPFYRNVQRCLYIGKCYAVGVDRHKWNSFAVLVPCSIFLTAFILWAHAEAVTRLELDGMRRVSRLTRQIVALFSNDASSSAEGTYASKEHYSSWTLLAITALSCLSALALFAPRNVDFEAPLGVPSYPTEAFKHANFSDLTAHWGNVHILGSFQVEAGMVARRALYSTANSRQKPVYSLDRSHDQYARTHRIGDSTYQSPRTLGIGLNMAAVHDYFLSADGRNSSFGFSPRQQRGWSVAPDFQFGGIDMLAHGTDIRAQCRDMKSQVTIKHSLLDTGPCFSPRDITGTFVEDIVPLQHPIMSAELDILWDVESPSDGFKHAIVHTTLNQWRVSPINIVKDDLDRNTKQRFAVSKVSPLNPREMDISVFECAFYGNDLTAKVSLSSVSDALLISNITYREPLSDEILGYTKQNIQMVLGELSKPMADLVSYVESMGYKPHDYMIEILEGMLGDLAQAYWSLIRQRIENPQRRMDIANGVDPLALEALIDGTIRGSYTRLGGQAWGLLFPFLMFLMPIYTIGWWVVDLVAKRQSRVQQETAEMKELLEDEEIESSEEDEAFLIPIPNLD